MRKVLAALRLSFDLKEQTADTVPELFLVSHSKINSKLGVIFLPILLISFLMWRYPNHICHLCLYDHIFMSFVFVRTLMETRILVPCQNL